MFFPMAVEVEIIETSPEEPFLAAAVGIDLGRMAEVVMRIDRLDSAPIKPVSIKPSGLISATLNDTLLDPFFRLFELLDDPLDAAIMSDSIVDEVYYRLLWDERGGELRFLLQQRGEFQRISEAVEYIHQNPDQPVSVEGLARMVHMSRTFFYENFRNVMYVSPL